MADIFDRISLQEELPEQAVVQERDIFDRLSPTVEEGGAAEFITEPAKAVGRGAIDVVGGVGSGLEAQGAFLQNPDIDLGAEIKRVAKFGLAGISILDFPRISDIPETAFQKRNKEFIKSHILQPVGRIIEKTGAKIKLASDRLTQMFPELKQTERLEGKRTIDVVFSDAPLGDKLLAVETAIAEQIPQIATAIGPGVAFKLMKAPKLMAAGIAFSTSFMKLLEQGGSFEELLALGVDKNEAAETATTVGTINALLELAPIGGVLSQLPGVKKKLTTEFFKEFLKKPKLRRVILAGVGQGGIEGLTEGLQEVSNNVGKKIYNENQDLLENFDESAFIGAILGALTGGLIQVSQKTKVDGKKPPLVSPEAQELETLKALIKESDPDGIASIREQVAELKPGFLEEIDRFIKDQPTPKIAKPEVVEEAKTDDQVIDEAAAEFDREFAKQETKLPPGLFPEETDLERRTRQFEEEFAQQETELPPSFDIQKRDIEREKALFEQELARQEVELPPLLDILTATREATEERKARETGPPSTAEEAVRVFEQAGKSIVEIRDEIKAAFEAGEISEATRDERLKALKERTVGKPSTAEEAALALAEQPETELERTLARREEAEEAFKPEEFAPEEVEKRIKAEEKELESEEFIEEAEAELPNDVVSRLKKEASELASEDPIFELMNEARRTGINLAGVKKDFDAVGLTSRFPGIFSFNARVSLDEFAADNGMTSDELIQKITLAPTKKALTNKIFADLADQFRRDEVAQESLFEEEKREAIAETPETGDIIDINLDKISNKLEVTIPTKIEQTGKVQDVVYNAKEELSEAKEDVDRWQKLIGCLKS